MHRSWLPILVAGAMLATPALAGSDFAAYEGRDAVQEGVGGTKIEADGVEFWTTGTPPHRYQILGVISDTRGTGLFSGNAVGNPGVAKRVRSLGGDAVIVLGKDTQIKGAMLNAYGQMMIARRATTQMLVVKYLDVQPQGTAAPQP